MEQILTGLGAEVIGTQMEPAPDPAASGLAVVFVMIGLVSFIVFVGLRLRPYVPFRSRTPESIAFLTSLLALYWHFFNCAFCSRTDSDGRNRRLYCMCG